MNPVFFNANDPYACFRKILSWYNPKARKTVANMRKAAVTKHGLKAFSLVGTNGAVNERISQRTPMLVVDKERREWSWEVEDQISVDGSCARDDEHAGAARRGGSQWGTGLVEGYGSKARICQKILRYGCFGGTGLSSIRVIFAARVLT